VPYRKLGRPTNHRRSMLRNLVTSFLDHGRIETTETRAKTIRTIAEKMITLGKQGDLHARRQALSFIFDESVVNKLFTEIAPRYANRSGGYTRFDQD
jgi:large subunit ribosomal protein L17